MLVVLLPVLALIALAVWLDDPHGSPLFFQERVGRRGRAFRMVKFRSMYVDAEDRLEELMCDNEKDGPVFKIKDDPRITRVGKFIRKTLDGSGNNRDTGRRGADQILIASSKFLT